MIIFVQMEKGKRKTMIDMNEIIANNIAILGKMLDSSKLSYTFAKL